MDGEWSTMQLKMSDVIEFTDKKSLKTQLRVSCDLFMLPCLVSMDFKPSEFTGLLYSKLKILK